MKTLLISLSFSLALSCSNWLYAQNSSLEKIEALLARQAISEAEKLINIEIYKKQQDNSALFFYKAIIQQDYISADSLTQNNQNHLDSAYFFYKKALIASKSDNKAPFKEALKRLSEQFFMNAIQFFNEEKYQQAFRVFENSLSISENEPVNEIDSLHYYNVAFCAEKTEDFDKISYYYNKLLQFYPEDQKTQVDYIRLCRNYEGEQSYIKRLKDALKEKKNELIYNELIAYYFEKNDKKTALNYLHKALEDFPQNTKLLYIKASLLQEEAQTQKASEIYRTILKINPEHSDAAYNLGLNCYNEAAQVFSNKGKDYKKKIDILINECILCFKLVLKKEGQNKEIQELLKSCDKILEINKQ